MNKFHCTNRQKSGEPALRWLIAEAVRVPINWTTLVSVREPAGLLGYTALKKQLIRVLQYHSSFESKNGVHMRLSFSIVILAVGLSPLTSNAQSVTQSWLRQAGISCGGGLSVELQGEIDAAVFRRLKVAKIEGEGSFQQSDTETLLNQFKSEEKRQTYVDYVNCLIQVMNLASNSSNLPPREVVLDSPVAVAALETAERGQRFVLESEQSMAIADYSIILTVHSTAEWQGQNIFYYSWSDSESDAGASKAYAHQAQLVKFKEKCAVTPYKIDLENGQVSFISNC